MKIGNIAEKPPKIKHKFLRRALTVDDGDEIVLKKVRLKRLYISQIHEMEPGEDLIYDLRKHRYLKKKILCGLKYVQLGSLMNLYWFNELKNAQNLQTINMCIGKEDFDEVTGFKDTNAKIEHVLQCMKKFPKKISSVNFYIEGLSVKKGHLKSIYRIISSFRELETYWRLFGFQKGESYVEEEFKLINRYLSRLPKLEEAEYDYWRYEKNCWEDEDTVNLGRYTIIDQRDFQKFAVKDKPCSIVTNLTLNVVGELFRTFNTVRADLEEELSDGGNDKMREEDWVDEEEEDDDDDEEEEEDWEDEEEDGEEDGEDEESEEDDDEEEEEEEGTNEENEEDDPFQNEEPLQFEDEKEKDEKLKEEIAPFYNFHLFPNTKCLNLQLFSDCLYPLGPFVIDGFVSLKKLERLGLKLDARPVGTKVFFEALLHLPLLNSFSLEIPFIRDDEWKLLDQFFKKQTELVSLSLIINEERGSDETSKNQSKQVEHIKHFLQNKPKLQYLDLEITSCPLENLSKALENTEITNQLKSFTFEALDDKVSSKNPSLDHMKGLCEFIRAQKTSLTDLKFDLDTLDISVITELTRAISELEELKTLEMNIVKGDPFGESGEKPKKKKKPKNKKEDQEDWFVDITNMLKSLTKLDDLAINLTMEPVKEKWFDKFLAMVQEMTRIRTLWNVEFNVPFSKLKKENLEAFKRVLLDFHQVSFIAVDYEELDFKAVDELEETITQVNLRQSLRCDLMF